MISLSTIDQANRDQFDEVLKKVYPDLWFIKMALDETHINPLIVPKILRSLSNLALGTGFGKVQVFMQQTVITQIKGEESINVNQSVLQEQEDY